MLNEFEVRITPWPLNITGNIWKKKLFPYKSSSFKPPLIDSNCFKKITALNFKPTTFENRRQFTLRKKYYFKIIGGNKLREHTIIKPRYTLKHYSSNYWNATFECPFGKNMNLSLEINEIDQVCRFIQYFNFLLFDKITFTMIYTDKVDFIYFNNSNLLQYIGSIDRLDSFSFYKKTNVDEKRLEQ